MHAAHWVASTQAAIAIISAALLYYLQGKDAAISIFFGSAVAIVNALLQIWCLRAGVRREVQGARQELAWLVRFSLERFVVVALLMAAGLGWLKLMPVPLLAGFVLGQLTLVVSAILYGIEK